MNINEVIESLKNSLKDTEFLIARNENIVNEKFQETYSKIETFYEIKSQTESKLKDSFNIFKQSIGSQKQEIKKFQTGLNSVEENIKDIKVNINNLVRPKTPPIQETPPPPPPVVPILPVIPLDEIYAKIDSVKQDLIHQIIEEKEKTFNNFYEIVKSVETQAQKTKNLSEQGIEELKDKLSWLPLSLNQLEGMSPGEARLFTIEARLRSEENARIQAYNNLTKLIENSISMQSHYYEENKDKKSVSPLPEKSGTNRNNDKRPTPLPQPEWWKKALESERKNCSESGSILGGRLKFSTPMPELEENIENYARYKDVRRHKAVPKSWDLDSEQITRMQTAAPNKSRHFKPLGKTINLF